MPRMTPEEMMKLALAEAMTASSENEVPIGAALVFEDGGAIADHNRSESRGPIAHAEMLVLERALAGKGRGSLEKATLYVTVEPCIMCLGAMVHARIGGLVYGAAEPRFGGISILEKAWKEGRYPFRFPIHGGLMASESSAIMKEFFSRLRRQEAPPA